MILPRNELLVEAALVFALYLCATCYLACYAYAYIKYDCVKATIHSKTYFGMEKDACVPTRPMNGVCLGLVFNYGGRDYTGYAQSDHDKQKVGDKVDLCVEKSDPAMFTTEKKHDAVMVLYWLLLMVLLCVLTASKLTRWAERPALANTVLGSVFALGVLFFGLVLWMKSSKN